MGRSCGSQFQKDPFYLELWLQNDKAEEEYRYRGKWEVGGKCNKKKKESW